MPRLFATRLLTRNGSILKSGVLLFQNLFVESIRVVGIKRFVGVDDEYHICFPDIFNSVNDTGRDVHRAKITFPP